MPLLYSAIAKGREILVECNQSTKHVASLASYQLRNTRNPYGRQTGTSEGYNYHFLFQGELAFLAIAEEKVNRSILTGFVNCLRDDFVQKYGDKEVTAQTCKGFSSTMKQSLNHCNQHPEELCKVAAVKKKVDEVKRVVVNSVDQVLGRGEKLTVMVEKADDLHCQAMAFEKQSKEVQQEHCWQLWKLPMVIMISLLVLGLVIACLVCFSNDNCRPPTQKPLMPPEAFLQQSPAARPSLRAETENHAHP